ncbi:hypothetical protein U9M48_025472 [Paspalum notatum var. saurae]|uniref:Uncharacterized protein n=1 Tax=Paspalum notatum var. saurae TaxID=547442 RepID=A0AAQ3TQ52_PASNO
MLLIWKVAQNWTLLCPEARRQELYCRLELLKEKTRREGSINTPGPYPRALACGLGADDKIQANSRCCFLKEEDL